MYLKLKPHLMLCIVNFLHVQDRPSNKLQLISRASKIGLESMDYSISNVQAVPDFQDQGYVICIFQLYLVTGNPIHQTCN